jgi:hypothetical protein
MLKEHSISRHRNSYQTKIWYRVNERNGDFATVG